MKSLCVGEKLWDPSEINSPNMAHRDTPRGFLSILCQYKYTGFWDEIAWAGRVIWSSRNFNQCASVKQIFPTLAGLSAPWVSFLCQCAELVPLISTGGTGLPVSQDYFLACWELERIEFHEPLQPAAEHLGQRSHQSGWPPSNSACPPRCWGGLSCLRFTLDAFLIILVGTHRECWARPQMFHLEKLSGMYCAEDSAGRSSGSVPELEERRLRCIALGPFFGSPRSLSGHPFKL